ncbi:MAG: threonine synthase [Verrucomicrobiota bacterium]|nr:threonine synthase [Verrucomicrobiota bacterium]
MNYVSTRGGLAPIGFQDAVLMGLSRDGGLIVPDRIPDASAHLAAWRALAYPELAAAVMGLFADLPVAEWRTLVARSYAAFRHPDITPVVAVGPIHILELSHGPSLAFKDIALQFLGNLFDFILSRRDRRLNVVAATSGDTGSAAIQGLRGKPRLRIFVMYPHGRVSPIQEAQMTSVLDGNVFNLAIEGAFDDCQRILKELFNDLAFRDRACLGSVNSINWARLLPQVVYYFYAAFRVMERTGARRVRFAVPTGNFGDIFAGYLAARMGLPIARLVLATNENDVLARFYQTGVYHPMPARPTISPSMDIQVASNFERYLYYRAGEDPGRVLRLMKDLAARGRMEDRPAGPGPVDPLIVAGTAGTSDALATIRECHERHGYLLDPHGAVGVCVASRHLDPAEPMISLATAHPAKFAETIRRATGRDLAHHPALDSLQGLPTRRDLLPAETPAVRDYIAARV